MSGNLYPPEWETLSRDEILTSLPQYHDSSQLFHLAEWSLARGEKHSAFYYYMQSVGRGNAHLGVLNRAFEMTFCDTNYALADWIAVGAKARFPEDPSVSLMLARIAATRADELDFKNKLREAEQKGAPPEQIANVKKYSSHFFTNVIAR